MSSDREVVDRVRSASDIVRTVGEVVSLRKAGRRHVGLCPFHAERTPSFSVDEQKQLFHCFGCGAGGDVFKFMMMHEKIEFPEALSLLAEKNGIELPRRGAGSAAGPRGPRERLYEANAEAAAYFRSALAHPETGRSARDYIASRGIQKATIERLGVGYAPRGWDGLRGHLLGRGFKESELAGSGLVVPRADGGGSYDRFRDRIVFPIITPSARIVGFGGRALAPPASGFAEPKYLNSPETAIYSKGETLFGLYHSREALGREKSAILVEGYLDFASLFEAGIEHVVASLGTALSDGHARVLARYVEDIVVCYDGDTAGRAATLRALTPLVSRGLRVRVLRLPSGEDPDSFVRRVGADGFREALGGALDQMDYVIEEAIAGKDLKSAGGQVAALNEILPHLAAIRSPIERSRYVPVLADRLRVADDLILAEAARAAKERRTSIAPPPPARRVEKEIPESEAGLVRILVEDAAARTELLPRLGGDGIGALRTGPILSEILAMAAQDAPLTYAALSTRLRDGAAAQLLTRLAMRTDPPGGLTEGLSCLASLERERLKAERHGIQSRIEKTTDATTIDGLLVRKVEISRRIDKLS
jgi:DNA primase